MEISPRWQDVLRGAGLESFAKLMAFQGDWRVSHHKQRDAHKVVLPDGRAVFLKRNFSTQIKHILADIMVARRPEPLVVKEARAICLAAAAGVTTPDIIVSAQRRRWFGPHQGVLLLTELPGEPMDIWLARSDRSADALVGAGEAIARLYRAGLSWPDLLPKHVFLSADGQVGLLDLERLRESTAAPRELLKHLPRFCRQMRRCGANEQDMRSLLAGLCEGEGLDADAIRAIVLDEGDG